MDWILIIQEATDELLPERVLHHFFVSFSPRWFSNTRGAPVSSGGDEVEKKRKEEEEEEEEEEDEEEEEEEESEMRMRSLGTCISAGWKGEEMNSSSLPNLPHDHANDPATTAMKRKTLTRASGFLLRHLCNQCQVLPMVVD
ncbi:hypothetical protein E2C01_038462 [Portunus trituberculatus]|uniref:Uncharacterized protein n=1 Tax=Portunus trituberculatus TaxID=210409 RepID=A0A5B7FCA4_PORTR|nr:hypothetical protein [Portunus trituberculatus]